MVQHQNYIFDNHTSFKDLFRLNASSMMAPCAAFDSRQNHVSSFEAKPTKWSVGDFDGQPPNCHK
jgi:hypothetical protein